MTARFSRPAARLLPLLALAAGAAHAQAAEPPLPQTVVVTATRHAMLGVDAPAALSVVTRRELELRGADNALDALRSEPAFSLQGRAVGGRKVLGLRGMDSKHTLFLVNGQRIGASDGTVGASDFQLNWIAVEDIERIEVVRGPMSVLYGSEAMGGVVNIITRAPGSSWRGSAAAQALQAASGGRGGDGRRASASADGPLAEGLALRAGAAYSQVDAVASQANALISELESRDKRDGFASLVWQPATGQRLAADVHAGQEERWGMARERGGKRRYHETVNQLRRQLVSLGWEAQWQPAFSTQLRAYGSTLDVKNLRSAGVSPNLPQRLDERVLEGQARQELGTHGLTGGFEARNEALEDPGLPGGRSLAQHRSLYLQDEWQLAAALALTAGLRRDDHSLFGAEWSPRAYAVWRPAAGWVLKGGASRGFKAPNLKQIVPGSRPEGPNTFLGNPQLQAESSRAIEFGGGYSRGAQQWQAMLFDQRVHDLIEVKLVSPGAAPGTGTYTYENLSQARLRGLELSAVQPLGPGFELQASATYLDARSGSGARLERRPRVSGSVRVDWRQGPATLGLQAEHQRDQRLPSTTVGQPAQPAPAVTLLNAHGAWKLGRAAGGEWELSGGVTNLGNVSLAEKSALYTQAESPRTWRLGLRARW